MVIYPYNLDKEKLELLLALTEKFEQGKGDKNQLGELEELLSTMLIKKETEA